MSSTTKPALLLIPGSFALPEHYDNILEPIRSQGYEIEGLHLPSVGLKTGAREGPAPTMYDDAEYIASKARPLVEAGKDVILFAHSYGGVPTSQSTKGLTKAERKAEGKKGGIIRIAYMTCVVPPLGGSAGSTMGEVPEDQRLAPGSGLDVDEKGWLTHTDPARTAAISFSDLSPEEGQALVKTMVQHSDMSFASELTHAGYKDVENVSWLFCEKDLCIPKELQQKTIEMIERESGRKVDVTKIEADHIPSLGPRKQEVIDWFLSIAGKA
ncbi:putative hydrolase R7 [Pseudocercospora fuligena]|uniref:Putative hydrolase R7 n=1 Tax=Pseudocercospora fuligena TaxID=685502 RepID=A0A8H6RK60_9PEZI|nr:putative hydrolase R7 [Pseudocercospora fuligena]